MATKNKQIIQHSSGESSPLSTGSSPTVSVFPPGTELLPLQEQRWKTIVYYSCDTVL